MALFEKDPTDIDFYSMDWSALIGAATISASTFIAPDEITKESESFTTTTTTVKLSGGTTGDVYAIPNTITTSDGRTLQRSINIKIVEK